VKVLVLGADGYLGWPTCMYFSQRGHEIIGVDNYFRRNAAISLDCEPLLPTPNLVQRAKLWKVLTGQTISIQIGDISDYNFLKSVFTRSKPDIVIHYAEQPSAPYSMMNYETASFTVKNNLLGTLNTIYAINEVCPDCHLIKLGTMGEYGTPNIDIEEGWIEIEHKGRKDQFLFPRQSSSLYHTTKIQDTDMLWFYVRTWGLRVTDLMQGPVYGLSTEESEIDSRLLPHFNYDEIFGTILNRFIVQAVVGHPLTIYGRGNQTRGYLNIKDTMQCVNLAAMNSPERGELKIFNQVTETFSVNQLAEKVRNVGKALGFKVEQRHYENPRVEKEDHYYNPRYTGLLEIGLEPHYLDDSTLIRMFKVIEKHKENIRPDIIFRGVQWK
jgi:UDP-sulfoquinovose synthase